MAGKKRGSDSVAELEDHIDSVTDKHPSKPSKVLKNEDTEASENGIVSSSSTPSSIKPMERRKKRKAVDKERHRTDSNSGEVPKTIQVSADLTAQETSVALPSANGGLPEFHIGVFKDLASADLSVREAAAEALVTELWQVQNAFMKLGKKGKDDSCFQLEAEKDDGLNNCASSVGYAIRRLIRGVSSSRQCARQGFALGLTILVGSIPCLEVDSIMKLIVKLLEVTSSMKGQEVRDCLLGRLFAYGALAQSGRIAEEWNSDKNTHIVKEFTSSVIALASKKHYLQEPAASIILDLIEQLPAEALLSHVLEAPGTSEWFARAVEIGNPDALLLALKLREHVSVDSKKFDKLLPYPFSTDKLFSSDHLSSLAMCFKESTFCQPRIHSIWPVLVNILLPDTASQEEEAALGSTKKHKRSRKCNSSEEDIVKNLHCFCEVVIEGSLLLSSHDRKHLALDVLLLLLPRLPASCVQIVLSHKLVHCLMDILSTKDSWLYKVAQHFVKELSDWVRHDDERRVAVIVALQKHTGGRFDCITRTKTIKNLAAEFKTGSGCMLFVQNLMTMFVDEVPAGDEPSDQSQTTDDNSEVGSLEDKDSLGPFGTPDNLKSWVIDSLPRVLKHLKLDPEAKFRLQKEIMKFLAVQGLFSASLGTEVTSFELQEKFRWPKAATSNSLCQMCIEQLQLLLANAQKEGLPSASTSLEPNDLGSYFVRFLNTLCNIPSVSLFRSLSDEDGKAFKKLQAMETRLAREERNNGPGSAANKLCAMRYLLIQLLLQVLLRPGEFSEAASEVLMCCKKAFGTIDVDSSGDDESDSGGLPELMDVLVDTLLSLLPQSSPPMRSAVEQVFKHFCNDVTDTGLIRMLRIIRKDLKPARHQPVDSNDDNEDEDDEDLLEIEEAEETDEVEEDEIGDSDDSDDEADDSEATGRIVEDGELSEDSEDSDEGMDDDAMFRMDSYLAQIFKEKKNQAGGETAQSQLVLFKLRVLSLLELYLHENPGKPQVFTVFSYLTQALVNPHTTEGTEQLEQRIWGILQKKIFKSKEYPKGEHIQQSNLESLLEKSLKWASKPFKRKRFATKPSKKKQSASLARHKMIATLAKNSTFWILKIIHVQDLSDSQLQKVIDIFQHVLLGYFDSKKSQLKSDFVKEIFRRQPWIGNQLFGFLLEKCGNAKSDFRRVEGLDLVEEVLKSLVSGVENKDEKYSSSRKFLKAHMVSLCELLEKLLMNMPEKQSRRAGVRRFCAQVLQSVLKLRLKKSFMGSLTPDAYAACESQLADTFLPFKSREQ